MRVTLLFPLVLLFWTPFASATWQLGTIAGAEYDNSNEQVSPIVLPWFAYQSDNWQVNPLLVMHHKKLNTTNWRIGMTLDHSAWKDTWTDLFSVSTGIEAFWGPIRFDNSAQLQVFNSHNLNSRHTAGMLVPVSKQIYAGIESGFSISQQTELRRSGVTWVNGFQLQTGIDNWRMMALGSWDKNLQEGDKMSGLLSIIYEW